MRNLNDKCVNRARIAYEQDIVAPRDSFWASEDAERGTSYSLTVIRCQSDKSIYENFESNLNPAQTRVEPKKLLNRFSRFQNLIACLRFTQDVTGAVVECGVLGGFTSRGMFKDERARVGSACQGEGFYLIDSFEGLAKPAENDALGTYVDDATQNLVMITPKLGSTLTSPIEVAKNAMKVAPKASFLKGWIPEVLTGFPEQKIRLLHVDVDHYEPTLACLEFFYPMMAEGGVIITDDYITPLFPGARLAWRKFCQDYQKEYLPLDSGQAVMFF